MTEQSLGVAKIGVEIATDRVESGASVVRREVQSMSDATVKAADTTAAAWNRQDKALLKSVQTFGMDREARLRWSIAQRASAGNVEQLTAILDKQVASLRAAAAATENTTQVENTAAREKLKIVRHNGQIEESERSLAERRRLGADATKLQAAVTQTLAQQQESANRRVAEMAAAEARRNTGAKQTAESLRVEQNELEKLIQKIDPTVAALARLDQQEQQLARFRKSGALDTEGYTRLNSQIQKSRELVGGLAEANVRGGMSARAHSAALRNIPAQFTDIMVSLQAGQAPLTVLLQQGGQLKDMFGGIGPAFQALGGYVVGLVNPLTVAGAALGTLGVAAYQGSQELGELNRSLISSGNAAGISASGLNEMAAALASASDVTQGKAVDALAAVSATGAFTGEQMQMVAAASLEWSIATGKSMDDIVQQFTRLTEDPVAAILTLDKSMGFLTDSQLAVIRKLVEQGEQTAAATEAIRILADVMNERSGKMVENAGSVERAWRAVKGAVASVWDGIKSVGRDRTIQDNIDQLRRNLENLEKGTSMYRTYSDAQRKESAAKWRAQIAELEKQQRGAMASNLENTQSPEERARRARQVKFEEETTRQKTTQLNLEQQIAAMKEKATKEGISAAAVEARERALREADARKQANKVRSPTGDGGLGNARIQAIKAETQAQQAELKTQTEALRGQLQEREISVNDYYAKMRGLAEQATAVEVAGLRKQQEVVRQQTGKRAESGATAQQVLALEQQIAAARAAGAASVQKLSNEEEKARQKREEGLRSYREALAAQTLALEDQMTALVDREKMGQREFEMRTAINGVLADQARELREIAKLEGTGQLEKADADARRDSLRDEVRNQVQTIRDGYTEVDAARADWMNGLTVAMKDFATESMNISGQIAGALGNVFDGMTDAIVEFTQTGKLSFSDLARSILADLTRIAVKIAITKGLEAMFGGIGGGATASLSSQANSIQSANLQSMRGWATGGYTGAGSRNTVAGYVHKDEVVFNSDDVARHGGPAAVERLRLGGSATAMVGGGYGPAGGGSAPIINLIGLEQKPKETRTSSMNGQMQIDMIFEAIDARAAEGYAGGTSQLYAAMNQGR